MPIAVFKGTKQPVGLKWNANWSVRRWRHFFIDEDNKYDIGLLWNQGTIDVETDNENSNIFLNKLIGNIQRPIYKSSRSYHNLFLTPNAKLTKVNLYGKNKEKIEIFGNKTFTMAPPSQHIDGITSYQFINDFWPPPPCPNSLKALYFQQKKIKIINKEKTLSNCVACSKDFCIHKKRLKLEVQAFNSHNKGWMCKDCRGSLPIKEECKKIRKACEYILHEKFS